MKEETIYDKIENRLYRMIANKVKAANYILDIGCGDCQLVNFLAKETKNKVIGIDIKNEGFAQGRREARKFGVSGLIKCIKADAQSPSSFHNEKFEAAVCVYAFHEFEKPLKVLKQIKEFLKRKGKILIVDFIKGSTAEKLWSERYYTPAQVKSLLKRAGFNKIETEFPEDKELVLIQGMKTPELELRQSMGRRR